jgi:hypothetical protein
MVDAAIERIAREQSLSPVRAYDAGVFDAAIEKPAKPTRLRWKGLDVSDEFRSYAERVARGEQLPPFEGRVLAEPNAAFPWGPLDPPMHTVKAAGRAARAALWCSAAVVLGLLTWSVALEFQASRERALLPPLAASSDAVEGAPGVETAKAALPHDVVETPARPAPSSIDERVAEHLAFEKPLDLAAPTSVPSATAPTAAAVPAGVATAVAPLPPPAFEPPVPAPSAPPAVAPAPRVSAPVPAAATPPAPAPVAAPVAVASAAQKPATVTPPSNVYPAPAAAAPPEVDFGIDAASASSGSSASAPLKSSVTTTGSVGDLARSGQVPGAGARKEPGSESSAKGSLLVENPSF